MTKSPRSVAREAPLSKAMALMDEHHIRHLPVMFGDRMLGVISERDVILVNSLKDLGIPDITVEDAMTTEPYTVAPDDALGDVVRHMAEKEDRLRGRRRGQEGRRHLHRGRCVPRAGRVALRGYGDATGP